MSDETNKKARPRRPWTTALHFLAFGVLIGLMLLLVKGPPGEKQETKRIVVTTADVAQVKAKYERLWRRPPTQMELRSALEQYVRDEVLYREALGRGLDRGDPTVRLAMIRKITMLGSAQADAGPTNDKEIDAYFSLRQERYRIPALLSFVQIYLNLDKRGDRARADSEQILTSVRQRDPSMGALASLGDPTMLRPAYRELTEQEVGRVFGTDFKTKIIGLKPGEWQGPIESGYGLHLVKVTGRTDSRIPDWTEVRQQVWNDMQYEARKAAEDQFYQEIVGGYQIVFGKEASDLLGVNSK
jgi:hypothetical protein